jgi:hypothetical protein
LTTVGVTAAPTEKVVMVIVIAFCSGDVRQDPSFGSH